MAESPRRPLSLLDELQSASGFEAGLLATYSSYAPFVEEVVLPRLRAAGCHYLIVLADRAQLAYEFADRSRRPAAAGRRYGLLPIACGGAFHPKLALLVGPKRARVIIGSHNLTISGVIQNREVTNVIDVSGPNDRAGAAALVEALEFCTAWAEPLSPALRALVEHFRNLCAPYLGPFSNESDAVVVGSRPSGPSLWQRTRSVLPDKAKRAVVIGPFFDRRLAFIQRLVQDLALHEVVIGLDSETACFPGDIKGLPSNIRVAEAHELSPGHKGRGLLHAKAILLEHASGWTLITGSANPTAGGWLAPPASRNAELVVVRRLQREDADDLGLARLVESAAVEPARLSKLRSRPEVVAGAANGGALLVGICHGTTVQVEGKFRTAGAVIVRDPRDAELTAESRIEATGLFIELGERAHDASTIEVTLDGVRRHGFVHQPDLLREAALSSSQRRVREALRGLSGDDSQLECLLRLVEKVIFDAPVVRSRAERRANTSTDSTGEGEREISVAVVASLTDATAAERRHLSGGDLGLLLDYLMRKVWQSLSHESSSAGRSELELIDAEDEEPPEQPPTDARIAEAWHRKSRTLLKRLLRRLQEGGEPVQAVFETAAVLGVLEAVRRVEDHDRWRQLQVEFVDREAAALFLLDAVPGLLMPGCLLERATAAAGAPFAEQRSLTEWLVWLAWLTGFGPADSWEADDGDERSAQAERADRLARACLIGARAAEADEERLLGLLEASPFPGVDARLRLAALVRLGAAYAHPETAATLKRAPQAADLVVTRTGAGPYVVRCVRGNKADLIDFSREQQVAVFMTSALRVLDAGITPPLRTARD